MSLQLDIFDANADPLIGITIKAAQCCCPCGNDLFCIGPGRGAHRSSLHCARCKRPCGWLSDQTAKFLSDVVEHFGRPTAPVCVRRPGDAE